MTIVSILNLNLQKILREANIPSQAPMTIRKMKSCHLCLTQTCSAVDVPQIIMQLGTHLTMPYFLPSAAPRGCSATKKAKKSATAVLTSSLSNPISAVKWADSALPICSCQFAWWGRGGLLFRGSHSTYPTN
jgi:hypothetical protein